MGKLIFILGGARSGKSTYAQELAKSVERERGGGVAFIATAEAGDEEMRARIEKHRRDRPPSWDTVEAPMKVAAAVAEASAGRAAVVVDCLTLLISNLLLAEGEEANREETTQRVLREVEELIEATQATKADVIVVSNEVGMGIVPSTRLGRLFRDIAGQAHQLLARAADEMYFILAGLPQKLK